MVENVGENKDIPDTWCLVQHHDVAIINPKIPKDALDDGYLVSFIPMAAVEECSGKYDYSEIRPYGEVKKGYTPFIAGDLVFAKITPCMENGKVALLKDLHNNIGFGSTEFHVSRLSELTNKKYFFYFFVQQRTRRDPQVHMTGSAGQLRVPKAYFEELEIPLPPLPEQHRIVDKIEELFSDLDDGIASLKKAQHQLKVYRQAVLKWAFEGKLTAQWREEQKRQGKLESAETLLAQIKAEREQRYQSELAQWQADVEAWEANGKVGKKPGKPSKYKEPAPLSTDEIENLDRLPEGWVWIKIGSLSHVGTGVTPLKKKIEYYEGGTIPWVTSGALNDAYVREPSGYVTYLALEETNLELYPVHTLLVALYGEGKTRGKCSELLIEATTNQAIAAIVQEGIEVKIRKYLKWFLQKNYDAIRRKASGGVQPNLNLSIIENTIFPICSLSEQVQIVEEIESRLSICDSFDATIFDNLQRAEALRQSILKQAFEGKLVPQDPNDEPASVLLERIRTSNAAQAEDNKQTKRKQSL